MKEMLAKMDYDEFKYEINRMINLDLDGYKEGQMKRRINALIEKRKYTGYDDYVCGLKSDKELLNEFINYLTINVSEFYRNPEQWEIMEKEIMPMLLERSSNPRIWSSACSTGDEPYTLAMVMSNCMPLNKIKIIASDIDEGAIAKAKTGIYSKKSVSGLPDYFKTKYFTIEDDLYKIKDSIKNCVEFRKVNLLDNNYPNNFDLILCRNVIIYFTNRAKDEIYRKFNKALKLGGVLFIGSTEQIISSVDFALKPVKTFFYVKEAEIE
jgi:chemotaxis protein methyltransferase CheR